MSPDHLYVFIKGLYILTVSLHITRNAPARVVSPELHHGPHLCPTPVLTHGHTVVPGVVIITPTHRPVTLAVVLA